jgi:hypothetical protein
MVRATARQPAQQKARSWPSMTEESAGDRAGSPQWKQGLPSATARTVSTSASMRAGYRPARGASLMRIKP